MTRGTPIYGPPPYFPILSHISPMVSPMEFLPLQECGQALVDDKVVKKGSDIARGSPEAIEQLVELLVRLMQLHQQCCGEADLRWKVRGT